MKSAAKVTYCSVCYLDGGIHYSEDGTSWSRPHLDAARTMQQAQRAVELAHEQQTKAARDIVHDAALRLSEFSANNLRVELDAAQIDGPVVGAAFTYAADTPAKDDGTGRPWIAATGRTVQSTDPHTRHRIFVWSSLVCKHSAGRVA